MRLGNIGADGAGGRKFEGKFIGRIGEYFFAEAFFCCAGGGSHRVDRSRRFDSGRLRRAVADFFSSGLRIGEDGGGYCEQLLGAGDGFLGCLVFFFGGESCGRFGFRSLPGKGGFGLWCVFDRCFRLFSVDRCGSF